MSDVSSLHAILIERNCTIENVRAFLDRDTSSINEINELGHTPLFVSMFISAAMVKLLISHGADVTYRNSIGDSLLMSALIRGCDEEVIKVLSETLGATYLNELEFYHEKPPLVLAIIENRSPNIVNLLLQFGARVDFVDNMGFTPLSLALMFARQYETVQLLVKYSYMKIKGFNIGPWIAYNYDYPALANYATQCANEVREMESIEANSGRTLGRIMRRLYSTLKGFQDDILISTLDCVFRMRVDLSCPIYFELLVFKLGKRVIIEKLQQVVFDRVRNAVYAPALGEVLLHYGVACKMAEVLTKKELLCLILAFYIPHN